MCPRPQGRTLKTYTAANLKDLWSAILNIKKSFGNAKPWRRGHARADWDLLPAVHRPNRRQDERNVALTFQMMAKVRYPNSPSNDDYAGWLFLMQHDGLPTRLLDGTESPLIALYFAVEKSEEDGQDGAVWALHPGRLNNQQVRYGKIPSPDMKDLAAAFGAVFRDVDHPLQAIVCLRPYHTDLRHLVQQSVTTTHGSDTPINRLPCNGKEFLARITLTGDAKQCFRAVLDVFNVRRADLFPDLDNLAKHVGALRFGKSDGRHSRDAGARDSQQVL